MIARLVLVLALVLSGLGMAADAAGAAVCPSGGGSLPKSVAASGPVQGEQILAVRAGTHPCFDRVVVETDGPTGGARVQYVAQVTADPSGQVVAVPGGARLQVVALNPGDRLGPVGRSLASTRGFPALRSVVMAGSFEGQTTIGVGTRARLPFRLFVLNGPGAHHRVVLDVAHRWS